MIRYTYIASLVKFEEMKRCSFLYAVIRGKRWTSWRKALKEQVIILSALNAVNIILFVFRNAVLKEQDILVEFY
jgi:hypothetical protein